jgi:hypothetical protein
MERWVRRGCPARAISLIAKFTLLMAPSRPALFALTTINGRQCAISKEALISHS